MPTKKEPVIETQNIPIPFNTEGLLGEIVLVTVGMGARLNRNDISGSTFPGIISAIKGDKETLVATITGFAPVDGGTSLWLHIPMRYSDDQPLPYWTLKNQQLLG